MAISARNTDFRSLYIRIAVLLLVFFLLSSQIVRTKEIGLGPDTLLSQISVALDSRGIDVVLSFARDFDFQTNDRPRVARLGGFPSSINNLHTVDSDSWRSDFTQGMLGYIAALRPVSMNNKFSEKQMGIDTFIEAWKRAPMNNRVFIAFTREDKNFALKTSESLRSEGMVVFTYLKDGKSDPWVEPELAGRFFRESGHHFVIDSQRARASSGVAFEALNYTRLKTVTRRTQPTRKLTCEEALL